MGSKPKSWPDWLSWAEYWFNITFNAAIKLTPFEVLYGRPPPVLFKGETYPSKVQDVQVLMASWDEILAELKDNMLLAQQQMKAYADNHRREVSYAVGDWVFFK